ncbi:uncharacterized protein [Dermacentor andersoni]|uniref:uncharacterized protein isoform X2 n=1 Tax=Dermacentor andersoni TaxID=34620 RepID=UPI002415F2D6|nr:uncharacterized protein LOC129387250 [Dermacentor andersoni]
MKHVFAVFCILSSLLCSASTYNLQLSDYSVETLIGSKSKEAGKEAILVGEILRHAARELAQNKAHYSETDADEYFFRSLWGEIVAAIKNAARVIWDFLKELANNVKEAIKEVALAVVENAGDVLRKKATEKALEIVAKMFQNSAATYSTEKYHNKAHTVKEICARMDLVGRRLIEEGKKILAQ